MRQWCTRSCAAALGVTTALTLGVALPAAAASSPSAAPAASASATPPTSAAGSVSVPPPTAGTQTVADDGTLRMDMNMQTGYFDIVDERNGAVFASSPNGGVLSQLTQYAQNETQRDALAAQFDMGYTTVERLNETPKNNQFNNSQPLAHLTVQKISNGVAMTYNFATEIQGAVVFTADLTLESDHLVATIPYNQILEGKYTHYGQPTSKEELPIGQAGCPRLPEPPQTMSLQLFYFAPECQQLTSIHFLPAFGAGMPGQEGYIVVPDGSGALINFDKVHPVYTTEYRMPVYGDPTITPLQDEWLPEDNMPVFGIVHLDSQSPSKAEGMLAVITEGAANASIVATPAGQRANLYQASVKFDYRPQYEALSTGMSRQLQYAWKPLPGDRQVVYYFVNGTGANYSGLAQRYRQYLMQTQHVQPLPAKPQAPFLLRVLNGIREIGVPFAPFERATTFAQTQQMATDLQSQGVGDIRLTLEGWMLNGYAWDATTPQMWPPDRRLGGTGGLVKLAEWGKAHNVQLVLASDVEHAWSGKNGFNPRKDALHQESQLFLLELGKGYLISPDWAAQKLYPQLEKQIKRAGVSGTDFDYLARDVYPNYQPQHMLDRQQATQQWTAMMSSARDQLGSAGAQGGSLYALGSADYFYNAPLDDSGFNYETRQVPFWEIAVHGLALYSGRESNLMSNPQLQKLQMIEDGALPVWELTWQTASSVRYTYYKDLYSSQYAEWSPQAVSEYKQEQQRGYSRLAYVQMTNDSEVQPGVDVVDYADGSHVIVNYNDSAVTLAQYGNVTVPAQDYTVIPGGGGH